MHLLQKIAASREHIPSKMFLEEPFLGNLFLVLTCRKCDNSFSQDKLCKRFILKTPEHYSQKGFNENSVKRFTFYPDLYESKERRICFF